MHGELSRRTLLASGLAAAAVRPSVGQSDEAGNPPRVGVIGLGNRSGRHLRALGELRGVEVVALSDIQSDRMRAARQGSAANAEMYTDFRELIADSRVQAVTIATPNYLHAEMAIAALRAGKDVLVEKPIGLNYEEALAVAAAARETGRTLAIGMQRYFKVAYRKIVEAVNSGAIGTPYLFSLNEYRGDWNPRTWRWPDPQTGKTTPWRHVRALAGSSLLEFSVHSYALLYEMIGHPLTFCAATGGAVHWPERSTEDNISVIAEFGDVRLQHTYSGSAPGAEWAMTITGGKGSLQYDFRTATIRAIGSEPRELDLGPTRREGFSMEAEMYRDFFSAIRRGAEPALNAQFAIEASKIAYAAWTSIDERRIVTDKDYA